MKNRDDIGPLCAPKDISIQDAIARMDQLRESILLIVDGERRLLGTVTDGDIRRVVLARLDLNAPIETVLRRKEGTRYAKPFTAPEGLPREAYRKILKEHRFLHLPLVDKDGRVQGLVSADDFVAGDALPLKAVVMAGGKGSRLYPLTKDTPKPMLQVGDKPLMEIILGQLRDAGIRQVHVATHHQPEKITNHFRDGKDFGVQLSYVHEDQPLGTAGALGLIQDPKETMLVINGDVLTQTDFRAMLAYHQDLKADLTIGVRQYEMKVPYGIVECDGPKVRGITEKPRMEFFVSAGIYLLEPVAHKHIPAGEHFDMTDLIARMIQAGHNVASFPIREYWLDIGQHADYALAQEQATRLGLNAPVAPAVKPSARRAPARKAAARPRPAARRRAKKTRR